MHHHCGLAQHQQDQHHCRQLRLGTVEVFVNTKTRTLQPLPSECFSVLGGLSAGNTIFMRPSTDDLLIIESGIVVSVFPLVSPIQSHPIATVFNLLSTPELSTATATFVVACSDLCSTTRSSVTDAFSLGHSTTSIHTKIVVGYHLRAHAFSFAGTILSINHNNRPYHGRFARGNISTACCCIA
ncbi:hypothetical protein PC116_g1188 [Phytophthora cactorum]|uniref:Uncharacterized protein n=1 Tax=Phytophthora cactorum TaxID=29920 RepID=A0A8T1EPD2_9STRA|nr:hypothetical protein Pcac1_g8953 [Phytophthora cactorum]KAG2955674.1 hypothetical protein PC117_g300 [Phytophthora cactorum]KAG3019364.1 hypothetical protein PC120_g9902 [Phytophthora cactorum]KAG4058423.1 hypothetical protein PC123_g6614 [Phytophthora cactorum]KAG4251141.1 hypothetical protein PC116_g1188 [Phytophthora cactorum]